MKALAVVLASLLLILTFNAYACVLPQPVESSSMPGACGGADHQTPRQSCDAFITLGPYAEIAADLLTHDLSQIAVTSLGAYDYVSVAQAWSHGRDAPPAFSVHPSVASTVLRL